MTITTTNQPTDQPTPSLIDPNYYLKFMNEGRRAPYARVKLDAGVWLDRRVPIPCRSGYHYVRNHKDVFEWAQRSELWVVRVRGVIVEDDDKGCAEQMKLVKKIKGWDKGEYFELAYKAIDNRLDKMSRAWNAGDRGDVRLTCAPSGWDARQSMDWKRTDAGKYLNGLLAANGIERWGK